VSGLRGLPEPGEMAAAVCPIHVFLRMRATGPISENTDPLHITGKSDRQKALGVTAFRK